jgi:hypothetical protein
MRRKIAVFLPAAAVEGIFAPRRGRVSSVRNIVAIGLSPALKRMSLSHSPFFDYTGMYGPVAVLTKDVFSGYG